MHGKGTLEVSLACLTRPYYVQGAPREEKGPNQIREKLGGLRLLTGLALYKALGKMFCRLNCLVCTAYPISPASTGEKLTHFRLTQKRQKVRNRYMGNACTKLNASGLAKSPTSGTGLGFLALTNLGPRNSCRSSTELLLAPFADLAFSHLLTREGNQLSRSY